MGFLKYDHISTILSQPENLEWIQQALEAAPFLKLDTFCIVACLHFGFIDRHGQLELNACIAALRDLARQGLFSTPDPAGGPGSS